jgi:dTDP-glucose 4,6-dehydratase
MKNILVTGGAGFIGSNFIRTLLQIEPEVRIFNLDALTYAGSLENLKNLPDDSRHTLVEGNICDRELVESVLRQQRIDSIPLWQCQHRRFVMHLQSTDRSD